MYLASTSKFGSALSEAFCSAGVRRHFKPRRVRPNQQFTPVATAVLELRLILTVMRVHSRGGSEASIYLVCTVCIG